MWYILAQNKGRPPNVIPKETRDKIVQMYNETKNVSKIRQETGVSFYTIEKVLKEENVNKSSHGGGQTRKQVPNEIQEQIISMYNAGKSIHDIEKALGFSFLLIRKVLESKGIAIRDKGESMRTKIQDPVFREQAANRTREQSKALWQDPEYAKMQSNKRKETWKDPAYQKLHSDKMKKMWEDPEFAKNVAETNANLRREQWQNPEYAENVMTKRRKYLDDPEYLENLSQKMKASWAARGGFWNFLDSMDEEERKQYVWRYALTMRPEGERVGFYNSILNKLKRLQEKRIIGQPLQDDAVN
jgi:transposase-like protein